MIAGLDTRMDTTPYDEATTTHYDNLIHVTKSAGKFVTTRLHNSSSALDKALVQRLIDEDIERLTSLPKHGTLTRTNLQTGQEVFGSCSMGGRELVNELPENSPFSAFSRGTPYTQQQETFSVRDQGSQRNVTIKGRSDCGSGVKEVPVCRRASTGGDTPQVMPSATVNYQQMQQQMWVQDEVLQRLKWQVEQQSQQMGHETQDQEDMWGLRQNMQFLEQSVQRLRQQLQFGQQPGQQQQPGKQQQQQHPEHYQEQRQLSGQQSCHKGEHEAQVAGMQPAGHQRPPKGHQGTAQMVQVLPLNGGDIYHI